MFDWFGALLELAPPPASAVDAGSPGRWSEVEQALGTPLPSDYKRLINTYGSGEFCDLLWLLNPFSAVDGMNLLRQVGPLLEIYREGRERGRLEQCPHPLFPEPGGLLPLGGDTNGGNLFWITNGPPEGWILVFYDWRGGYDSERHAMSLSEFLVSWLSGRLPGCFLGAGLDDPIVRRAPVFCPAGMIRPSQRHGRDGSVPSGSEAEFWGAHIFHRGALSCSRCGAVRDCSSDLDLASLDALEPGAFELRLEEHIGRAVDRARASGWRLIGYPDRDPSFLCPDCAREG